VFREVLQLDYVLTDSWTVRDANGKRIKAFSKEYDPGDDPEAFMKWYVDWIIEILETTPLDIWSHPMWVTRKFTANLEQMWTPERMRRVVMSLKNTNTAVEIDSSVKLPTMPFLKWPRRKASSLPSARAVRSEDQSIDWSIATAKEPDAEGHERPAPAGSRFRSGS
jgi:hypothetical protein